MEQPQITHVQLPIPLVEEVLNYLAERPFREVQHLIAQVSQNIETSITIQKHKAEADGAAIGSSSQNG